MSAFVEECMRHQQHFIFGRQWAFNNLHFSHLYADHSIILYQYNDQARGWSAHIPDTVRHTSILCGGSFPNQTTFRLPALNNLSQWPTFLSMRRHGFGHMRFKLKPMQFWHHTHTLSCLRTLSCLVLCCDFVLPIAKDQQIWRQIALIILLLFWVVVILFQSPIATQ